MVIGITVDEVLRNFIDRFCLIYQKYDYTNEEIDYVKDPITDPDLISYFRGFKSKDDLNRFLYEECPLEVFGHAGQLRENLMNEFNKFLIRLEEKELGMKVRLISREAMNSVPATYFFLSKTGCRVDDIKFVTRHENKWDYADVLVTASPKALEAKPEGKIGVKVNCSYNQHVETDHSIDRIESIFKFDEEFDKIENDSKLIENKVE